ncbi:MAG TPA: esterase-like activity of phytase family protein [Beijerinckiaceae bacterium]
MTLAGGAASARARPAALPGPVRIEVTATPIERFSVSEQRQKVGLLTFRSGLELRADEAGFGGFSGLWRSPGGEQLVALSDRSNWLTARVESSDGRLARLADAVLAPVLGRDGRPLRRTRSYDTEALAIADGAAFVGIERSHEVMRFAWGKDGVRARGQPLPVPAEARDFPRNRGFEAIGVAPAKSPLAGAVIVIAERARDETNAPTRGFILGGPRPGAFDVARSGEYDITDLAFLASGEMLLLERRFSLLRGPGARLRRIAANAIQPGALVDGPVIFEADAGHQIDNMEGLAVHRGGRGETVVTMISDNNFSSMQRTLLLEFTLEG